MVVDEYEALMLLNQSMIMIALSALIPNKELAKVIQEQAERTKNKVDREFPNE